MRLLHRNDGPIAVPILDVVYGFIGFKVHQLRRQPCVAGTLAPGDQHGYCGLGGDAGNLSMRNRNR
jgi:hypothetical protein